MNTPIPQQARAKRLEIEKYVYKNGTNAALSYAEDSDEYKRFRKSIERAFMSQIHSIAKYKEVLPILITLAKAQGGPLVDQVGVLLAKVPLSDKIDLEAYLVWAGTQGGQAFVDKMGIDGIFGLKDQRIIDYFSDYSKLLIQNVDKYTKEWIAGKIQEGKDKGFTPFEIQQLLIDEGKKISAIRAERIVLTETAKAMAYIESEAARKAGIKTLIWRTSIDERVCAICEPLEGKEAPPGEDFEGGYQVPAHVSCRCYYEEVVPDNWVIPEKMWLGE